jgi:hypothetical protein
MTSLFCLCQLVHFLPNLRFEFVLPAYLGLRAGIRSLRVCCFFMAPPFNVLLLSIKLPAVRSIVHGPKG